MSATSGRSATAIALGVSTLLYTLLGASLTEARADPVHIVALGDSNTNGDGIVRDVAWPARLEKLLRAKGYDVKIRNAGVSGDTTGEGLARLDRAVPEATDVAIVFFGRNDMRFHWPIAKTERNIEAMVKRLGQRGIQVLVIGFEPYDFAAIAKRHGAAYYPDFFAGVAKNGHKLRRDVLPLDPVRHLNPSGHKVIAEGLLPAVEPLIRHVNR